MRAAKQTGACMRCRVFATVWAVFVVVVRLLFVSSFICSFIICLFIHRSIFSFDLLITNLSLEVGFVRTARFCSGSRALPRAWRWGPGCSSERTLQQVAYGRREELKDR